MGKKRFRWDPMTDERRSYLLAKRANRKPLAESHPELAKEWVYALDFNGEVDDSKTPLTITRGSIYKVLWRKECNPGIIHEWVADIISRAVSQTGCPRCRKSIMEKNMSETLETLRNELHIKEIRHGHYVRSYQCYPDFLLILDNGKFCVIEMDGQQHFYPVSFGSKENLNDIFEMVKKRDARKNAACEKEDWCIMRINYTVDISDYKKLLCEFIRKVNHSEKWFMICHGLDYNI